MYQAPDESMVQPRTRPQRKISMNKRQFIAHYLRMNRTSYLLAIVFIFLVNWLQVEIPRYIQLAIDLIDDASSSGHQQLQTYVWIVVGMSVAMVVVRILSRIYARLTLGGLQRRRLRRHFSKS